VNGEPAISFDLDGARAVFTTRAAPGQGRGPESSRLAVEMLGVPHVARLRQIHGDRVVVVTKGCVPAESPDRTEAFFGYGDALVSSRDDLALGIVTADCIPLLLADREGRRAAAAAHAGWRGVVAGIVERTLEVLDRSFGVAPSALVALAGPAAGGCCYEVGPEVVEELAKGLPGPADPHDWLRPGRGERPHVDLRAVLRRRLLAAGVPPDAIHSVAECTICSGDRWPSWRREGNDAGRILAAIAIR
jgi:YfiH family protein